MTIEQRADEHSTVHWSVGGVFLEALAERDYDRLSACFAPDVHFRALLPSGPRDSEGADGVADSFRTWFGAVDDLELVDAAIGEIGGRLHLSWRFRVRPAPFGIGDGWHLIEQQAYADASERIETLDLLCSGFKEERGAVGRSS